MQELLYYRRSPNILSEAILKILKSPEIDRASTGKAIRKNVEKIFDFPVISVKYIEIYKKLIRKKCDSIGSIYRG
ncbi:hypothetical protein CMK18_21100 [Candidatus Poribacteria bacterium]|nr:hypothetical protein [Candidatus Poribacteria bacterium]